MATYSVKLSRGGKQFSNIILGTRHRTHLTLKMSFLQRFLSSNDIDLEAGGRPAQAPLYPSLEESSNSRNMDLEQDGGTANTTTDPSLPQSQFSYSFPMSNTRSDIDTMASSSSMQVEPSGLLSPVIIELQSDLIRKRFCNDDQGEGMAGSNKVRVVPQTSKMPVVVRVQYLKM